MENIKQIAARNPLTSQTSSGNISTLKSELTIYTGTLTPDVVARNMAKLKSAFPALPAGFYDILIERIKDAGFSNERLNDAVDHVIDSCKYPMPTVADFMSFDRKYRVYTYNEMVQLNNTANAKLGVDYKAIRLPDRPNVVWVHVDDIERFNLTTIEDERKNANPNETGRNPE